ncbi:MAG: SIS domain-containing protein [Candidatus Lokiarchaeota archaeon]|nr:SIS domain-containing protein [Candidatus Lokiarchaeota archaeon]
MNLKHRAEEILAIQQDAIANLKIDESWSKCIEFITLTAKKHEKIITTGIGKAGIIAQKMSATLASIGVPSFYVHPAEALHGDIGRITPNELIIIFSHSGNTKEIHDMITNVHTLNDRKNTIILISGNNKPIIPHTFVLCYGDIQESSSVMKVPSTSTTIMLIIADVLAITAAESLGFNDEWFKKRHPAGAIGQSYKNS